MSALSPDDVVLIAKAVLGRIQTVLRGEASHECLALESDGAGKHGLMRGIEPSSKNVDMVFVRELPVQPPEEGRVAVKVQVFLQIDRVEIGGTFQAARRGGVHPGALESDFVRIKFVRALSGEFRSDGNDREHQQTAYQSCGPSNQTRVWGCRH